MGTADNDAMSALRTLYLEALERAFRRPADGDAAAAVRRFLTLNAAYFLGEWLPAPLHEPLVRRLAGGLDGLADIEPPVDELLGTLLAQHVRELTAAFEPVPWLARTVELTSDRVPTRPDAWVTRVAAAIRRVEAGGNGGPLLRAHAHRRLWDLANPPRNEVSALSIPAWALHYADRAVATGDQCSILVAEALLAELAYPYSSFLTPTRSGGRGEALSSRG
jgi:hypothetical protein